MSAEHSINLRRMIGDYDTDTDTGPGPGPGSGPCSINL
jgi:hypothetical protein